MKKRAKHEEPPVVVASWELSRSIEDLEALTRRVSRQPVHERAHLARAGELLKNAAEGHQRFLTHLTALSGAIDELRQRLGASATVLAHEAERIDGRRASFAALEERFNELGEGALRINTLVQQRIGDGDATPEALSAIAAQLAEAANAAVTLTADARTAGFTDLEEQAHARSQQLRSLHGKIAAVVENAAESAKDEGGAGDEGSAEAPTEETE